MNMTPEAADVLRHDLLGTLAREHPSLIHVIEACPEDMLGYRPHIKSMTFACLAFHCDTTGPWFLGLIGQGKKDAKEPKTPKTKAALVKQCNALNAGFIKAVAKMTPAQLAAEHDFLGMGKSPAVVLLQFHLRHFIHHRGQLQMMLRMMGAKCPAVYGPSGDVSFEELQAGVKKAKQAAKTTKKK
jgi:uncharacterized damage-inducible protein DinB